MWRCKECGGERFRQDISGGDSEIAELDENGCVVDRIDCAEYGDIYCMECGRYGDEIYDIAWWED